MLGDGVHHGGAMDEDKAIRRRCEQLVRRVEVPVPFDLAAYCARLTAGTASGGRKLVLVPVHTRAASASGVWLAVDTVDYVLFEAAASPLHRVQIVLHEVGHMVLGHGGCATTDELQWAAMFPHLTPGLVRMVLGRTSYRSRDEREAETYADIAAEHAGLIDPPGAIEAAHLDPVMGDVVDRLVAALETPPRRHGHHRRSGPRDA
jgi:hypothetical protein